MSRALVISVGTGIGRGDEAVNNLAGGIAYSIDNMNPDTVFFVVSEESRLRTLPRVLSLRLPPSYEVIQIESPDNIQRIFNEVRSKIEKIRRQNDYMAMDYTSGTKAMTSALAMLGILYEADTLCNVTGERKNGIVQKGTESLQMVRPIFAIAEKKIQTALGFFNSCQYEAAISIIEEIENRTSDETLIRRLGRLKKASEAYSEWDRFDHEQAFVHLRELKSPEFNANKRFLGTFLRMKDGKKASYCIADLYNNALRRGDVETKYDDAVARLYRVIELLAQNRLKKKYDIDTSDVPLDRLPETWKKEWGSRLEEGKLKMGLHDSYGLLSEFGDELGKMLEKPKMRDLLSKRNFSILAHGLTSIDEKTYSNLKEEVYKAASEQISNLDKLLEDSAFPKLE